MKYAILNNKRIEPQKGIIDVAKKLTAFFNKK